MQITKEPEQPGILPATGGGEAVIGLRIWAPDVPGRAIKFPDNNRIATQLMRRLLATRIQNAGGRIIAADCVMPFNRAFCLFTVARHSLPVALNILTEELGAMGLLDWAQIAWHDSREEIWRMHCGQGKFREPKGLELSIESTLLACCIEEMKKHLPPKDSFTFLDQDTPSEG